MHALFAIIVTFAEVKIKKALKTTVMYLLTGYSTLKAINWKDENLL